MANEDLKAILDERGVEYNNRSNRKQLQKKVDESEPTGDEAPLLTDETADQVPDDAPEVEAAPEADEPAPAPAPSKDYGTGTRGITRIQPNGAWTCPFCDFANGALLPDCAKCGADRDGEQAKR